MTHRTYRPPIVPATPWNSRAKRKTPRMVTISTPCAHCRKPIGTVVREAAGDPYCSNRCAKLAHGLPDPDVVPSCKSCGCDYHEFTPGCDTCTLRQRKAIKQGRLQ